MTKHIIICDLDGTAALMDQRIKDRDEQIAKDGSKKNSWNAFNRGIGKEPVNEPVLKTLQAMSEYGYTIIYLSGRSSEFYVKTDEWLINNQFPKGELRMRKKGDYRSDKIIKLELIEDLDLDEILMAIDDRDQVVELWRKDLGIPCFQVNYGDF